MRFQAIITLLYKCVRWKDIVSLIEICTKNSKLPLYFTCFRTCVYVRICVCVCVSVSYRYNNT